MAAQAGKSPFPMSQNIELPDPLFAEISDFASEVAASPVIVLRQAWDEFRDRHPAKQEQGTLRNPPPLLHLGTLRPMWTSRSDLMDELYERDAG